MRRILTTEECAKLLAAGAQLHLPETHLAPMSEVHYEPDEYERAKKRRQITQIAYDRDDEVQCISIDHPDHMYITDGFIPTHNTNNLIFLKSNDDSMIETLSKMSGTRHKAYRDSKTVQEDLGKVVKGTRVDSKVSYTTSLKEEAVIKYGDLAYLNERNSIVFRAGDMPIWNRNEMILPMSWRLFMNTIKMPGKTFTLQTIPTLSTAAEFDVRKNQPDFEKLLKKRIEQALLVEESIEQYQKAYGYKDVDIARLDPDLYSADIMEIVDAKIAEMTIQEEESDFIQDMADYNATDPDDATAYLGIHSGALNGATDNPDVPNAVEIEAEQENRRIKRYAEGLLSRGDLITDSGAGQGPASPTAMILAEVYHEMATELHQDVDHFTSQGGNLCSAEDPSIIYVANRKAFGAELDALKEASTDEESQTFAENEKDIEDWGATSRYDVRPAFLKYLATFENWSTIAGGRFDGAVANMMCRRDKATGL